MDYKENSIEYKDSTPQKAKYYFSENIEEKKETPQSESTFDPVFRNIPTGGSVASNPTYYEGIIYFTSLDTHLYALDAENGQMLWKFKTGGPMISTPTVHNKRIYFGSMDSHFYCLDLDGNLVWKKHVGDIVVSWPTVVGNRIFIAAGTRAMCLSEDGNEEWVFNTGDGLFCVPAVVNGLILFASHDKNLYALDINGTLKWKFTTGGYMTSPIVVSHNNTIFCGIENRSFDKIPEADNPIFYFTCSDNNVYSLDEKGRLLWKFNHGSPFATAVRGEKESLYAGNAAGYMCAINMKDGTPKWSFRTGGIVTAAASLDDDLVYVTSWDGKLYCLSKDGEKLWDFLTGGPIAGEPIIADNRIYFGSTDTHFYCLDIKKRTVEWTFQCGFGLPESLQGKISQVTNMFIEHDKKIFKVWMPETTRKNTVNGDIMQNYSIPSGFRFEGEAVYTSFNSDKSDNRYVSKRKFYSK